MSREQAISGVTSGLISLGEEVEWKARHFGLWLRMRVKITAFNSPLYFQDAMVEGPFSYFRHDHFFEQRGRATEMLDVLKFSSLPLVGRILDPLIIGPHLRTFLVMRNQALKTAAESQQWRVFLSENPRYN